MVCFYVRLVKNQLKTRFESRYTKRTPQVVACFTKMSTYIFFLM